jgi:MscS family membrane protein
MQDFLQNIQPYQIAMILFIIAIITYILLIFILKKILIYSDKTKNNLDNQVINALIRPLKLLFWVVWFYYSVSFLKLQIPGLSTVISYIYIIPVIIIAWAIIRVISAIENYLTQSKNNPNTDAISLFARLSKMFIIVVIFLGITQYFGFSIASFLTFGGVGGIVIGFAAKDMLANIFGGLMIQLDKPFSIGDWIRSDNFEGNVEKIGWRVTRIRTFSKNPIYIPNSIFSSMPIETPSRMTNRRIYEKIGIRYQDIGSIANLIVQIETMLNNHSEIDNKAITMVYFNHFGDSSLEVIVYTFTKTTNWIEFQKVKGRILLEIAKIIDNHKAQIAFPTQTLYIEK